MIDSPSSFMLKLARTLFRTYKQPASQQPAHETNSSYKLPATMPYTAVNAVSAADSQAPDKRKEWIIQVKQQSGSFISKAQLLGIFSDSWFQQYPSTLYGYIEAKGMWVKVQTSSTVTYFNKVQLGIDLVQKNKDTYTALTAETLQASLTAVTQRTAGQQPGLDITPQQSSAQAATTGEKLAALLNNALTPYSIILHADTPFDNDRVYTTLSGVGIGNESGALTHYNSQGRPFTDFTIQYTQHPLPETAGLIAFSHIIFSFVLLPYAQPEQRWKMMVSAARYCFLHLGGRLTDSAGNDFNEEKTGSEIMQLVSQLKARGIQPGFTNHADTVCS